MRKKTSIILVLILLVGVLVVPSNVLGDNEVGGMADLESLKKAEKLKELGLLKGTGYGFALDKLSTRAEALTMVLRLVGEEETATIKTEDEPIFIDVAIKHWAYNNINYGAKKGYIEGTGESKFSPDREIKEKEFIKILLSAMGHKDITLENVYNKAIELGVITKKLAEAKNEKEFLRGRMIDISYGSILNKNKKSFAWELNKLMPKDKNYMFSPLSIKMALSMAAVGADGKTKEEILKTLNIDDLNDYMELSQKLIKDYSENDRVSLSIANSIWLNDDYYPGANFAESYEKAIKEYFDGTSNKVNNKDAVEKINSWVDEKSKGKIKEIIEDSDFLAYLVNAIYFKGEWAIQFKEEATKPDDFTDKNGIITEIDFMNIEDYYSYYGDDSLQIIKLPYKDGKTSMYIALSDLNDLDFTNYINKMERRKVALSFPKFKTELSIGLNSVLKDLGIREAFNPDKANLKPMFIDINENPFISDVIHKTFIEVDENGTEAAAVTAVGIKLTSLPIMEEPVIFKADKPFTYFIYDEENNEILFMGKQAFAK